MDSWIDLMRYKAPGTVVILVFIPLALLVTGCSGAHAEDPAAGAPPAARVVPFPDAALFTVDHPEQSPLSAATARPATSELAVTGAVTPDISKQVPVPSLATG